MRVKIISNGVTYISKANAEFSANDTSEKIYDGFINTEVAALKFHLEDGSYLVLGKDAISNAHFIFED